jgi:hypothetical protein
MTRIDSVCLVCRFLPDVVELWVNEMCVYRAQGDNAGLAIVQRLRAYYQRRSCQ